MRRPWRPRTAPAPNGISFGTRRWPVSKWQWRIASSGPRPAFPSRITFIRRACPPRPSPSTGGTIKQSTTCRGKAVSARGVPRAARRTAMSRTCALWLHLWSRSYSGSNPARSRARVLQRLVVCHIAVPRATSHGHTGPDHRSLSDVRSRSRCGRGRQRGTGPGDAYGASAATRRERRANDRHRAPPRRSAP